MVKNLKPASTNYKLCTTNYKVKGTSHDGQSLGVLPTNHEPLISHHLQHFPCQDGVAFCIGMDAVGVEVAAGPPFGIEQCFVEVDDDAPRFFSIGKEPFPVLAELIIVFVYVTGILPAVHSAFQLGQRRNAQVYGLSLALEGRDDGPYILADSLHFPVQEDVIGTAHDEKGIIPAEVELMEAIDHARRRIAALAFIVDMDMALGRDQGRPALVGPDVEAISQAVAQAQEFHGWTAFWTAVTAASVDSHGASKWQPAFSRSIWQVKIFGMALV